ncbi:unnamed protein product [Thlaspi arvense]|uniref:F-box domain-containing protein n=1 Tax=Thlaspi arvense TaxID=13288 RepID=A0AAU9S083_THLAR|nr:unnamed protein product [Thlaspi arvense]
MDLPEVALVNVLARFPLKSIARFRLMSREWRSLIDSDFFRDYYISFNSSSSVSWSIIQIKPHKWSLEIVGHRGCERWGLDRSPGTFPSFFAETTITKMLVLSCTDGLVSIYTEDIDETPSYYIGNPLLQEWSRIPLPSLVSSLDLDFLRKNNHFNDTGLVTKMENGIVVSYKMVWFWISSDKLDFMVYSSDSGTWETIKNVRDLHSTILAGKERSIALNGILHWLSTNSIIAYGFYGGGGHDGDGCGARTVRFPCKDDEVRRFKRSFTASEGSIVYLNEFRENGERTLRVWRLVKYTDGPEAWQVSWEIIVPMSLIQFGTDYFPVVMHPLNSEIIYLWSRRKKGLILFNVRTLAFSLHKEYEYESKCVDGCILSFNMCTDYMKSIDYVPWYQGGTNDLFFSQYVLPRWLHRLPRPHRA